MFKRYFHYFSFCPLQLVLSLDTFEKSLVLSSLLPFIRYSYTLIRSPRAFSRLNSPSSLSVSSYYKFQGMQYLKWSLFNSRLSLFCMFASRCVYTELLRPQSHRQVNQPALIIAALWPVRQGFTPQETKKAGWALCLMCTWRWDAARVQNQEALSDPAVQQHPTKSNQFTTGHTEQHNCPAVFHYSLMQVLPDSFLVLQV